jgi:nitroreductase
VDRSVLQEVLSIAARSPSGTNTQPWKVYVLQGAKRDELVAKTCAAHDAISTNPAATIFVHTFLEGGNSWGSYQDYNPFNIYRSGGAGVRIFMPAFGMLGVDYGVAFDGPGSMHNAFQFTIGQQIR